MANRITYLGYELKIVTKPQVFDEPKEMLVWNRNDIRPSRRTIVAVLPTGIAIDTEHNWFDNCAKMTESVKKLLDYLDKP